MSNAENFLLGMRTEVATFPTKNSIDEVMLFDRALSEEEINSLYNLDLS